MAARVPMLLTLAVVAAFLAGCGSSRSGSTGTGGAPPANTLPSSAAGTLAIAPAHPSRRSAVRFRFTAPAATGLHGDHEIAYSLSVVGSPRPGCVGAREASAGTATRGQSRSVTLGPAQLHGPWCPGRYSARVVELQRPHCTGSAPCAQNVRAVAIVARGTFTVRAG